MVNYVTQAQAHEVLPAMAYADNIRLDSGWCRTTWPQNQMPWIGSPGVLGVQAVLSVAGVQGAVGSLACVGGILCVIEHAEQGTST